VSPGREIELPPRVGGSTRLGAYLAVPEGTGPWPGVVVVFEAFGLDEAMRLHADRLARMGYLALIPDLYSDGGAKRCLVGTIRAMQSGQGRAFVDLEAARQWLLGRDDCTGKVGCVGFCMGGGFALLLASRGFDAASVNYGPAPKELETALENACPIVASYPGKDRMLRGVAGRLGQTLTASGVAHDVREYPQAGHSFLNDIPNGPVLVRPLMRLTGAGPEPASAADAWRRIGEFFDVQLGRETG
jgi:carboxymethylenebutenolidase